MQNQRYKYPDKRYKSAWFGAVLKVSITSGSRLGGL